MVRLQVALGAKGVRRGAHAARTIGPHLAAGHSALQQVSKQRRGVTTQRRDTHTQRKFCDDPQTILYGRMKVLIELCRVVCMTKI